jgi:hypothetical protein
VRREPLATSIRVEVPSDASGPPMSRAMVMRLTSAATSLAPSGDSAPLRRPHSWAEMAGHDGSASVRWRCRQ